MNMDVDALNTNEDIRQIKEELSELQSWKDDIGLPALQQKEQLIIENEQHKEEITALSLKLETYSNEVDKLKHELKELTEELDLAVERSTSHLQADSIRRKSLQHTEGELQAVHRRCEMLESERIRDKERIVSLTQTTTELAKQIEQYELILAKMEQDDLVLKDKMHHESDKLKELQVKYKQLDMEYDTQQSLTVDLKTEVTLLNRKLSHIVESSSPVEQMPLNKEELNGFHTHNKTLHIGPQTLRLTNFSPDTIDPCSDPPATLPYGAPMFQDYDTTSHLLEAGDTFRMTTPDTPHTSLKERLQMEFDDYLAKEKGKLIDKYKAEIDKYKVEMAKYKKQLMQQSKELKRLQHNTRDGGQETRTSHHRHNPNNEQDMTKCKVFGWSMW